MNHTLPAIGLIGTGGISQVHLPAWIELGVAVTVYSLDGAAEAAERYGVTVANSLEELLDACDIVDICTPTPTHRFYAEAALRAGKHVICEKPIALTRADAEAIAALALSVDRRVFPAHVVRYFPEYARAKAAVEAGDIGRLAVCRFTRIGEFPSWAGWFGDDAQSGGIVMDQMIHDLDIARWMSGEVTEVYAVKSTAADSACVTAQVVLTHESGALSYVTGVWGPPATTFATSFSLAGSQGVLTHDSRQDTSLRIDTGAAVAGDGSRPDISLGESPYLSELRDFLQACSAVGVEPIVSIGDGVVAVQLAVAANESIATGHSVIMVEPAATSRSGRVLA